MKRFFIHMAISAGVLSIPTGCVWAAGCSPLCDFCKDPGNGKPPYCEFKIDPGSTEGTEIRILNANPELQNKVKELIQTESRKK
jgi:hypothetical protein